jgi:hypothetical protein
MQALMNITWLAELSNWVEAKCGCMVIGQTGSWRAKERHPLRRLEVGTAVWEIVSNRITVTGRANLRELIEDAILEVVTPESTLVSVYKQAMDADKAAWKRAEPDRLPPTKRGDQGVCCVPHRFASVVVCMRWSLWL